MNLFVPTLLRQRKTLMLSNIAFLLIFCGILDSHAQITPSIKNPPAPRDRGQEEVSNLFQLVEEQSNTIEITGSHTSKLSGITHTYLRQSINGIGVRGTESSVHYDKTGSAITSNNNFVKGIAALVKNQNVSLGRLQAIQTAANQLDIPVSGVSILKNIGGISQKQIYQIEGVQGSEIPIELAYISLPGEGVYLCWELSIMDTDSPDWWQVYVDAQSGIIRSKQNLTLSCFDEAHDHHNHEVTAIAEKPLFYTVENEPVAMVGSYNVIPLPIETPNHGGRSLEVDPDDATASPFGWHDTNGVAGPEFTRTQGNNCSAYDDDNNTNSPSNANDYAEGGGSLIFDFPFNPTYSAGDQSEDAAVTNLFYWTNIIHDVTYHYGFDEAAGNFQENNYGNGGSGSDSVNSEAQDGSGTCNANFGTPSDGNNPRMQMYVCNTRDGDFDNGVIVHEYGHGISNRLTGGPAATACLQNQEQMGEGWSDYYALMLTMETGDAGNDSRGIGTWLVGQAANGPGIRTYPYSTNFAVNPHTYDDIKVEVAPHGVGSVWCAMLWEMTWELIGDHGFSSDFYTVTGNPAVDAGNVQALAIVTEAMKLQPCSPGFVDGRDAILQADQNIYGGANQCAIWDAFARRGLGYSASQGSTGSKSDGTEAFDLPPGTASFSVSLSSLCITEGVQTGLGGGLPTGGVYSGPGVTDDGNGTTFTFDPSVPGVGDATVTYTVTDACSGGQVDLDQIITINDGIPDVICQDLTFTLDASGSLTIDPLFNQATIVGGDNGSGNPGFTVLSVTPTQNATVSFDWNYSTIDGPEWDSFGYVVGTTYFALSDASSTNQSGSFNIDLVAGELFGFCVYSQDNTFGPATAVITNFSPGFIGQFEAVNFSEVLQESDGSTSIDAINLLGVSESCGGVSYSGQVTFDCSDVGTQSVEYTVTDSVSGLSDSCTTTITINPHPSQLTTFSGGSWNNGAPTNTSVAVFNDNYNTGTDGNVDACSCTIGTGATVAVAAGGYLKTEGNITVDGALIVEHQANVVQVSNTATVTNNGSIEVQTTSPDLASRDFMVLGSPMTGDTREGVWNSAFLVLYHETANFLPNPEVEAALGGGAENFADDNYDNWIAYPNGALTPGEGYIVRPQSGFGQPGGIFNYSYVSGTLNNGVVEFPIVYNTIGTPSENRNASPNVLANPYASAIFADDFLNANSMIAEVYFWEHLTPPSPGIPGAGAMNFDMEDISMYNLSGGLPANNDPGTSTQPNGYISTSQGFGVKASAGGTAIFNNGMRRTSGNTTLRGPESIGRERLWLRVSQSEYELQGTTLIAFTENTTAGLDDGYDSRRLATVLSLYSHLEDGSQELGIQSREAFNEDKQVPLGFSTLVEDLTQYKIDIYAVDGLQMDETDIYLVDNWNGTVVNLKEQGYEFNSGPGVFHNRFTVVFNREGALGIGSYGRDAVAIYPNPTQSVFNIVSPQAEIESVMVYDVQGRLVKQEQVNAQAASISLEGYGAAVYIARITTSDGTVTKQIVKH